MTEITSIRGPLHGGMRSQRFNTSIPSPPLGPLLLWSSLTFCPLDLAFTPLAGGKDDDGPAADLPAGSTLLSSLLVAGVRMAVGSHIYLAFRLSVRLP